MRTIVQDQIIGIIRKHTFKPNATGEVGIPAANRKIVSAVVDLLAQLDMTGTATGLICEDLKKELWL